VGVLHRDARAELDVFANGGAERLILWHARRVECRHVKLDEALPLLLAAEQPAASRDAFWIYNDLIVYTGVMSKHLVDIDEQALSAARSELGTRTIKETVNRALRQAVKNRDKKVKQAFEVLAGSDLAAREDAWR
jgi:Arc/MetJ family transcription regulator